MISAVVFDWGGVLIDNPSPKLVSYLAKFFHVSEKQFLDIFERYEDDFQKGLLTEKKMWKNVCTDLHVASPSIPSLWENAFQHAYKEKTSVFSLISRLKKKGYLIGFLSNTEVPSMKIFYDQHYAVFDVTVFSCVEKVRKPDPRIYHILLDRLQKQPGEVVFVDDRQENLDGARAVGMHSVLFTSCGQLIRDLSALSLSLDK